MQEVRIIAMGLERTSTASKRKATAKASLPENNKDVWSSQIAFSHELGFPSSSTTSVICRELEPECEADKLLKETAETMLM